MFPCYQRFICQKRQLAIKSATLLVLFLNVYFHESDKTNNEIITTSLLSLTIN